MEIWRSWFLSLLWRLSLLEPSIVREEAEIFDPPVDQYRDFTFGTRSVREDNPSRHPPFMLLFVLREIGDGDGDCITPQRKGGKFILEWCVRA